MLKSGYGRQFLGSEVSMNISVLLSRPGGYAVLVLPAGTNTAVIEPFDLGIRGSAP